MAGQKIEHQVVSPPSLPTTSVTASKKDYEKLWQGLFLMISILSAVLLNKVYLYQTLDIFAPYRKGSIWDLFYYSLPFALVFGILDHAIHYYLDPLCDKYYINHKKFPDPKARRQRCYTLVKWGYSLIYYAISSVAGYIILYNTDTLSTWLGGSGSCMNIYNGAPAITEYSTSMYVFYILQFGKHVSRAFSHIFIRSQGNFYEYALHHGLSAFLIMFSYLMNYWVIGVWVLFLHDISDFFLILSRAYRECRNRIELLLQCFYFSTFIVWIGSRIVLFSSCCIWPSLYAAIFQLDIFYTPAMKQVTAFPSYFMVFMLGVLEILQLFWTYYIARSFLVTSISTNFPNHNYD